MQVTTVSVNVRYSRQMADGSFKTVELGCEGTLNSSDDDWQEVQANLYHQLGDKMKRIFSGNGSGKAQNGTEKAVPAATPTPLPPPVPQREHWCQEHQTSFKRFEKDGRTWYSHKAPDGKSWCKES
jgi:hypothetical protein